MIGNRFLIDGWTVDVASGRISRGRSTARLEPQVMKVLVYLAQRPGVVIARDEFLNTLWGESFVGDAALTRCIYEIRRAFGDNPLGPKLVETVPKVGFRLIAKPQECGRQKASGRSALLWTAAASLLLMALILPTAKSHLENRAPQTVTSPASEAYSKALAHLGNPTRIANQNAIAMFEKAIRLDPGFALAHAGLANAMAQQALYWGGQASDAAEQAARMGLRLAPGAAEAHAALGMLMRARGDDAAALAAFDAALRLDPDHVDAIYNTADIYRQDLEFEKAIEHYLAVLQRDPGHVSATKRLGFMYLRTGDLAGARAWIDRVLDDTPLDVYANTQLAILQLVTSDTAAAVETCESVLELYPAPIYCLYILGTGNLKLGNYESALHWFNTLVRDFDNSRYGQLGVAQVLLATKQDEQGLAIVDDLLRQLNETGAAAESSWGEYWTIAACLALKGDTDNALYWLDKAADAGRRFALWDAMDSAFASVHEDRRFEQFVVKTLLAANGPV